MGLIQEIKNAPATASLSNISSLKNAMYNDKLLGNISKIFIIKLHITDFSGCCCQKLLNLVRFTFTGYFNQLFTMLTSRHVLYQLANSVEC